MYLLHGESGHDLPEGFLVVDLECTTQPGRIKAVDGNKVYLIGKQDNDLLTVWNKTGDEPLYLHPFKVLVGHNLKYDLEYIRRDKALSMGGGGDFYEYLQKKAIVLDTQFITYLHSGHTMKFASLDDACEYWGVPMLKTLDLTVELEKVGHDITKVPDIDKYLVNDVKMTTAIMRKMLEDPWVIENFSWILKMHEGYLGTHEIEYNGMHLDPALLHKLIVEVTDKRDRVLHDLRAVAKWTPLEAFEPSSNDHVAALLFGGTIETEERLPNGVYASGAKAGLPKFRIKRTEHECHGMVSYAYSAAREGRWKGKNGKWSVSEEILEELMLDTGGLTTPLTTLCEKLLEFRELQKLLGTYLVGLNNHVRTHGGAYYVFPQINTSQTATGRTSSSKPNMQNNPTHDSVGVASVYTSRFGEQGALLEVDFKQVEILALAILSNDSVLIGDILAGRDIHEETGKPVYGSKMTKEQRRIIKTINFGLIYGGSAKTLAQQAKVNVMTAAKAISSFYARYKGVKEYFESFTQEIGTLSDLYGTNTGVVLEGSYLQKSALWTSCTGRRYAFKTYIDKRTKIPNVSYTETRNYPIQGFATGDLVLAGLGDVWRKVLPNYGKDVKLVGLVHDSLRFDVKVDKVDDLMRDLKYTLSKAGESLNRACKKEVWHLPIKVTFSKGTDFFNMKEIE
jgi:DNA polymerase I-like protein with 3'-5' exonuclease and polymerase domains